MLRFGNRQPKRPKKLLQFSSSAEVDVSTSPSASTDDDESILETEQLEFENHLVINYSASVILLFPMKIVRVNIFNLILIK